jgi:multidrug efflux pump subunit AcrB
MSEQPAKLGISGRIARAFQVSQITPLLAIAGLLLGIAAAIITPKEEDPQIEVTMANVLVPYPGASVNSVENLVSFPLEQKLSEMKGVKHVYSMSRAGMSVVTVEFDVGVPRQVALVNLYNKIYSNGDWVPAGLGVGQPLVKPYGIDDVPMMAVTLWSDRPEIGPEQLAKVAHTLETDLKRVAGTRDVYTIGTPDRAVMVEIDPARLATYHLSVGDLAQALKAANVAADVGSEIKDNRDQPVKAGTLLMNASEVSQLVIGLANGHPVYLSDVARVVSGTNYPTQLASFGTPPGHAGPLTGLTPAVTLAIAKKAGNNAHTIATSIRNRLDALRGVGIPDGVHATVTRDYGQTANDKADELMLHLGLAAFAVVLLVLFALGWREAVVVGPAVVVTLAVTLFASWAIGFTINRVSLFALIFSIGILVDDAIVVVENITRHWKLPENKGLSPTDIAIKAVDEVGNPTILATMTVIAAILPMAFVGGLMGPYMRPIPIGASAAMIFSLLVAFVVTPWATIRLMSHADVHGEQEKEGATTRFYRHVMGALLRVAKLRVAFLVSVVVLLIGAMSLVAIKYVRVKMLPFDNKSEFQVVVDMPEGTSLEETDRVTQELADVIRELPEVKDYQTYVGTSGPYNFNGLVRHYFMRAGSNVADIQVNLVDKGDRKAQSHAIAKRVRELALPIAKRHGARIKVAEVPPGPPVLQTLVAEIYGPDYGRQIEIARQVRDLMDKTPGIVDVDWYVEDDQPKTRLAVDREKAALAGIPESDVVRVLRLATAGEPQGLLHDEREKEDVPIVVRLSPAARADLARLEGIRLQGRDGNLVAARELVHEETVVEEKSIFHKNLMPVVYVTADVAGAIESPVYAMLALQPQIDAMHLPEGYSLEQRTASQPFFSDKFAMKWDGEWHITYEVFRDLGAAFAVVLVLIYVLNVAWFQSFITPLVIMSAIPFSLVGILPAHGMMGAYFSATSMIGFIAGAGIVVRNSIILVDFIEQRLDEGAKLEDAVIDAGAVRFRPMLLTAAAVVVGAAVILFDPIFQGLAIALMAGEIASLALSRMTVPIVYYMVRKRAARRADEKARRSDPGTFSGAAPTPAE